MRCIVLMSVYNGKKYIEQQLDSIFQQQFDGRLTVYIRDDGSTDGTMDIVESYRKRQGVDIAAERGQNIGAAKSFLQIIRSAPGADYYAFCDQDDVWKENKLAEAIGQITKKRADRPVLWASNYDVTDEKLNILKPQAMTKPAKDPLRVMFYNTVPGCTMVFNRTLLQEMRKLNLENIRMHDILALNIVWLKGLFIFEPGSYLLYRQHGGNAIGAAPKKIVPHKWIKEKSRLLLQGDSYDIAHYAEQLLVQYKGGLPADIVNELELISRYRTSLFKTIRLLSRPYTKSKSRRNSWSIRCKILFHLI